MRSNSLSGSTFFGSPQSYVYEAPVYHMYSFIRVIVLRMDRCTVTLIESFLTAGVKLPMKSSPTWSLHRNLNLWLSRYWVSPCKWTKLTLCIFIIFFETNFLLFFLVFWFLICCCLTNGYMPMPLHLQSPPIHYACRTWAIALTLRRLKPWRPS